ncbi:MAG: ESPR domain-containing protein, partial [Burkholderiaceae bacterium]
MNHVYRSVWNQTTATFVAASETAGRGASGTSTSAAGVTLARFVLTALTAALMTAFGSQAHALPVGGNVSAG